VVRIKGVFRTGEDDWVLAQSHAGGVDFRPSSWRRDSRVEVLLDAHATADGEAWDAAWAGAQQR
jgi:hypothetical protein